MEQKAKIGWDVLLIIGIVFSCLGSGFTVLGVLLPFALKDEEAAVFFPIFGSLGLIFLIIGLVLVIMKIRKKLRCSRLLRSGNYIMAEILGATVNYNVMINGRCPYVVECQYRDMLGNIHIFKSRYLYFNPETLFQDRMVKVYVEGDNYKHYYVDIDGVLPHVVRH